MADARFEDGDDGPLHLVALDAEDLQIIAALSQDAVFPITEISWNPKRRRLALLVNRFRWEDREAADRAGRPYERVQSLLWVEDVLKVRSQGIDRAAKDTVLSLLDIEWTAGEETGGVLTFVLAGDGAIALEVEALEVALRDVTRPYVAPSHRAPSHPA